MLSEVSILFNSMLSTLQNPIAWIGYLISGMFIRNYMWSVVVGMASNYLIYLIIFMFLGSYSPLSTFRPFFFDVAELLAAFIATSIIYYFASRLRKRRSENIKENKESFSSEIINDQKKHENSRKCKKCGFIGGMKSWLRNYHFPQLILFFGTFFGVGSNLGLNYLPVVIFWVWAWGKKKCPKCGSVKKHTLLK